MKIGTVFAEMESAAASYCRNFPAQFARASGAEIFDRQEGRWLDFLAGAGALNYGHNDSAMRDALIAYLIQDGISMSLDLHTDAKAGFLTALRDVILRPRGLDYAVQFTGPTGTNAVEAALKLARKATGRTNVVHFTNGFHGVSLGALAATGNSYNRGGSGIPLSGTTPMPYDGYLGEGVDTVAYLDKMLGDPSSGLDFPAAVIVECVQGEGGLNVASADWLRALSQTCTRNGIVLIVDDIQCGCGRTGDFFSFEQAGIVPDMVVLSKSLSGYGLPLSVLLIRRDLDVWKPGEHNGTFRGNNLAFVTAEQMIRNFWSDDSFAVAVAAKAELVGQRLQAMVAQYPDILGGVKGRGMMQGVICLDPEQGALITQRAYARGLIIERCGPRDEVIKIFAPLVIPTAQLSEGLEMLEAAIADVAQTATDRAA